MSIVVLLSGGLDSVVCMFLAAKTYPELEIRPLFVSYGQANYQNEWLAANAAVRQLRVISKNKVYDVRMSTIRGLGGSTLISNGEAIPKNEHRKDKLPSTYVPMRNLVFLSLAAGYAEETKARFIYIGLSGYGPDSVSSWRITGKKITAITPVPFPDCTKAFLRIFQETIREASSGRRSAIVVAPVIDWWKTDIVKEAKNLGILLEDTWSCYMNSKDPCGECDACWYRNRALAVK